METRSKEFIRGVKMAASYASEYDGSSTHRYRLEDCILGKFNVSKRGTLRKNRRKLLLPRESWLAGFAVALSEVAAREDVRVDSIRSAARAAGLTFEVAKECGVDSYDLKILVGKGVLDKGVLDKPEKRVARKRGARSPKLSKA